MKTQQIAALCTLVAGVCMALIGQAHLLGDPWMHYISVIGIAATALGGGLAKFERDWNGVVERRVDKDWNGVDRRDSDRP